MSSLKLILFVGLLINGLLISSNLFSQEISDPEKEFLRIRALAFEGDYTTAASEARKLVNAFPEYGDARILLGRILAWQKDYDQAAAVIDTLLIKDPGNEDALAARKDITLWSRINTPVATDIRTGYYFDYFTEPYSRFWQVFQAGAGHRFSWGPANAGVNIGNLHTGGSDPVTETDLQFEVETYPTLSKKNYAYLAYAYSPGTTWFPTHRAAVEIWQMLPAGWAISGGMNYYYFDRNIFIALASVEKYISKYWLSGKVYVYFKDQGPTTSFYLNVRRYFNDIDYLQLTLGTGTAPDEPFDIQFDERLSANSIRLAYFGRLSKRLFLRIGAGYSREEYQESVLRDRFEGSLNLIYAIKLK